MMTKRGISPFGTKFVDYSPLAYGGSLSLPPVVCRSATGRHFRSLNLEQIRICFFDTISGPLDAPDRIPAGSHLGENVTCNGVPLNRKAQTIYAAEVQR